MIVALWHRWIQGGQWWWLALMAGVLLADVVLASWIVSWEVRHMREWLP